MGGELLLESLLASEHPRERRACEVQGRLGEVLERYAQWEVQELSARGAGACRTDRQGSSSADRGAFVMDPRDMALQALTPTVMVPRFGCFEPLSQPGHRFLVGQNGEWLEVRRAWMYARVQLTQPSPVVKPGSTEGNARKFDSPLKSMCMSG